MSVIITGMEMPENCAECPCLRHDSIDGVHAYQCNIALGIRRDINKKPKWCPLKSVKGLIFMFQREIWGNQDTSLEEYRSGLYKAIEIIKEYCGLEDNNADCD